MGIWGLRFEDGFRVGADTAEELAAALEGVRSEALQRQERIRRERVHWQTARSADRSFEAPAV